MSLLFSFYDTITKKSHRAAMPADSVSDAAIGARTMDDDTPHASATGTVTQLLSLLAKLITGITGETSVLTAPEMTIRQLKIHTLTAATDTDYGHIKANIVDGQIAVYDGDMISTTGIESTEIAPKEWLVDLVAESNITLSGGGTIQGVTLTNGMRVLTPAQTTTSNRDVWIVRTGDTWLRYGSDPAFGQVVRVKQGRFAGSLWMMRTTGTITRGTTALMWGRVDGMFSTFAYTVGDLSATLPDGFGHYMVHVTSGTATTAKVLTLPKATNFEGSYVWLLWEGTIGTGGSFAVAGQSETVNNNGTAWTSSREVGIFWARGGQWYRL